MSDMTAAAPMVRPLAVRKARVEPVADTDARWVRLVFTYVACATVTLVAGPATSC